MEELIRPSPIFLSAGRALRCRAVSVPSYPERTNTTPAKQGTPRELPRGLYQDVKATRRYSSLFERGGRRFTYQKPQQNMPGPDTYATPRARAASGGIKISRPHTASPCFARKDQQEVRWERRSAHSEIPLIGAETHLTVKQCVESSRQRYSMSFRSKTEKGTRAISCTSSQLGPGTYNLEADGKGVRVKTEKRRTRNPFVSGGLGAYRSAVRRLGSSAPEEPKNLCKAVPVPVDTIHTRRPSSSSDRGRRRVRSPAAVCVVGRRRRVKKHCYVEFASDGAPVMIAPPAS
ncbi:unnamed protein product [Chrysoparadoxa australica]